MGVPTTTTSGAIATVPATVWGDALELKLTRATRLSTGTTSTAQTWPGSTGIPAGGSGTTYSSQRLLQRPLPPASGPASGMVIAPPIVPTSPVPPVATPPEPPPPPPTPPSALPWIPLVLSLCPQATPDETLAATTSGNVPLAVRTTSRKLRMSLTSAR